MVEVDVAAATVTVTVKKSSRVIVAEAVEIVVSA